MARTSASSQAGFTLIEMMLVAALMIVIAGIALPNLRSTTETYRLSTAAVAVASKVHQARTNALKRNRPSWVLVDGTARTVQVQSVDATGTINIGGPEFMPSGIVFASGAGTVTLTFDSMGRPVNPPQTIQLLYPGSGLGLSRTVTVTSTGRVTNTSP
ncbi:MAG TPA: GspH/FimT family pseudopilin [Vicinamibacterales bacterium]|nr:GspH/FimT family pseudopilin [Vicinamibacterales bacterium]